MSMQYLRVPIQGKAVVVAFDMCSSSDIIDVMGSGHDKYMISV
jgi:hypothetical protein